jgi:hypothetical protein
MTRMELAGAERVDELRELWLALHHHHRAAVGTLPLVEDDELSWERRRALYMERLGSGSAFLVLAVGARSSSATRWCASRMAPTTPFRSAPSMQSSARCR